MTSDRLAVKPASSCQWDAASLGEIMLRLDPGDGRIHTAREFRVWEGGGEYNVVRGLRRCFGLRTTAVTAFADNPVGRLVEDFMLQGGVDVSHVKWMPFDRAHGAQRAELRRAGLRLPRCAELCRPWADGNFAGEARHD